jgi:hypothetical protein
MNDRGRSAPVGGYDFGAKRDYRRRIWSLITRDLPVPKRDSKILFLPSKEGAEIEMALRRGFREENLFAVDKSPALVATAKWRKSFPGVRFKAGELPRAAERFKEDGHRFDVALLDLCSNFSQPLIRALVGFGQRADLSPNALVSISAMRGRETGDLSTVLDPIGEIFRSSGIGVIDPQISDRDRGRIIATTASFLDSIIHSDDMSVGEILASGVYRSHRVSMIWWIFRRRVITEIFGALRGLANSSESSLAARRYRRQLGRTGSYLYPFRLLNGASLKIAFPSMLVDTLSSGRLTAERFMALKASFQEWKTFEEDRQVREWGRLRRA